MGLWVKAQGAEGFEGEKEISLIMKSNLRLWQGAFAQPQRAFNIDPRDSNIRINSK